jgi:acyl-CoA synthetase (AMP-forming)/AMP-acid ligase II
MQSLQGKSLHHKTAKQDVFLNWMGLDLVTNLTEIHLHALMLSAKQIHVPASVYLMIPPKFVKYLNIYKVSYKFAPNFFVGTLVRSLEEEQLLPSICNLAHLRVLIEANVVDTCEKLSNILHRYRAPHYVFIRPGYGMTETLGGLIYNVKDCPTYDIRHKLELANISEPIPGAQM